MNAEKDQSIARLLADSKDLIRRFESLVQQNQVEMISDAVQRDTLEGLDEGLEPAADAFFDAFLEEDAMSVVAEFRPPARGGKTLSLERIEQVIADKGIVHGILWDAITTGLNTCNLELKFQTGVVIARGTPPIPHIPEHLQLEETWVTAHETVVNPIRDVNFKEITPFVMVKKGDLIAHRTADTRGVPGTDVLGREVDYQTRPQTAWIPGPNIIETPNGFEADVDGRLVLTPPNFEVSPVLELLEGVGYKTGNIKFRGEVIVRGKVAAGFSIEVGRSLSTTDVLDAYQVRVGGDLTTPAGIIGNGDGRVEVGGTLTVKFLEHVYLLCQKNIQVENCILNSVVKTQGSVILGEKGILAGGQTHSLNDVELFQIGTATGPRTELYLGLDYKGMENIFWIRERSQELHAQLKKVDAAIPYGGARVKELMAAAKKLRLEIVQLTENARKQLMSLTQNDTASVIVRGTVFPGTHIEICHVQFQVTQKLSGVRFFLDKRKGTIAVEPIAPSSSQARKHQ